MFLGVMEISIVYPNIIPKPPPHRPIL